MSTSKLGKANQGKRVPRESTRIRAFHFTWTGIQWHLFVLLIFRSLILSDSGHLFHIYSPPYIMLTELSLSISPISKFDFLEITGF